MAPNVDLVTVNVVLVNGDKKTIKMERGTSFENKGGIFTAGEDNGILKMTNYQLQAFKAMANNYAEEGEDGIVLSKKDIQEAQKKYRKGEFVTDMSEFLPEGYRIESSKLTSAENMVQAYVTNGEKSQSATLKFSFKDLFNKPSQNASSQKGEKVINIRDFKNHPNKSISLKEGMLIYDDPELNECFDRVPYVENGKVKLKYDNGDVTCTYENGKLLKYEREITKSSRGHLVYNSEGDFQRVEFYPNGRVKSIDVNRIEFGEFDGARFKCYYDEEGNYISGQIEDMVYDEEIGYYNEWVEMDKEDATWCLDIYPALGVK